MFDVYRGEDIFPYDAFRDHDGIFEVVSFPGHEGHLHILPEGEFPVIGCVSVAEDLASFHPVPFAHDGAQVDTGPLVGTAELDQVVYFEAVLERDQLLVVGAVVAHFDAIGVHVLDDPVAFCVEQHAGVAGYLAFQAGADDGRAGFQQGYGLALHVRAHEGAVGVVIFQEGDHGSGDPYDLVGGDVHVFDFRGGQHGEFPGVAALDLFGQEPALVVERGVGLGDFIFVLAFCRQVEGVSIFHYDPVLYFAVRGFQEAHFIDFGMYAERRDKADVGAFRGFDGTEASIVRIVDVAHFEACAFAREAARA